MDNVNLKKPLDVETEKISILYVDDEENNLMSFKAAFRRNFAIHTATSAQQAKDLLEEIDFSIIISDQRMPGQTGVSFFSEIKMTHPEPIRILLTGYSDLEAVINAINKGEVYRYIAKPWDAPSLLATLNQALELFNLRKENKILVSELKRTNSQLEFYLRQKLLS